MIGKWVWLEARESFIRCEEVANHSNRAPGMQDFLAAELPIMTMLSYPTPFVGDLLDDTALGAYYKKNDKAVNTVRYRLRRTARLSRWLNGDNCDDRYNRNCSLPVTSLLFLSSLILDGIITSAEIALVLKKISTYTLYELDIIKSFEEEILNQYRNAITNIRNGSNKYNDSYYEEYYDRYYDKYYDLHHAHLQNQLENHFLNQDENLLNNNGNDNNDNINNNNNDNNNNNNNIHYHDHDQYISTNYNHYDDSEETNKEPSSNEQPSSSSSSTSSSSASSKSSSSSSSKGLSYRDHSQVKPSSFSLSKESSSIYYPPSTSLSSSSSASSHSASSFPSPPSSSLSGFIPQYINPQERTVLNKLMGQYWVEKIWGIDDTIQDINLNQYNIDIGNGNSSATSSHSISEFSSSSIPPSSTFLSINGSQENLDMNEKCVRKYDSNDTDDDENNDGDNNLGHKRVAWNRKKIEAEERRSKVLKSYDVNDKNCINIDRNTKKCDHISSSSSSSAKLSSSLSISPKKGDDSNLLFPIIKRSLHTLSLEDDDIDDAGADTVMSHHIKNSDDIYDNGNNYNSNGNGNNHNYGNDSAAKEGSFRRHKTKMNKYEEDNGSCNDLDAPRRQKMRVLSSSSSPSSSSSTITLPSKEPSTGPSREPSTGLKEPSTGLSKESSTGLKEPSTGLKELSTGLSSEESSADKHSSKPSTSSSSSYSLEETFPLTSNDNSSSSSDANPSTNANPATYAISTQHSDLIAQANVSTVRLQQLLGSTQTDTSIRSTTRNVGDVDVDVDDDGNRRRINTSWKDDHNRRRSNIAQRIIDGDYDNDEDRRIFDNYDAQSEDSDDSDFGFGGEIGGEQFRNSSRLYGERDIRIHRQFSNDTSTCKSDGGIPTTKRNMIGTKISSSSTSTSVNITANIPTSTGTGISMKASTGPSSSSTSSSSAAASIQRKSILRYSGLDIMDVEGNFLMHTLL
jgi:hypothetical protein